MNAHTADVRDSTPCLPSRRPCHSSWSSPKAVQSSHKNLPSLTSLSRPPYHACWLRNIQTRSMWTQQPALFSMRAQGKIRWGKKDSLTRFYCWEHVEPQDALASGCSSFELCDYCNWIKSIWSKNSSQNPYNMRNNKKKKCGLGLLLVLFIRTPIRD